MNSIESNPVPRPSPQVPLRPCSPPSRSPRGSAWGPGEPGPFPWAAGRGVSSGPLTAIPMGLAISCGVISPRTS